MLRLLRFAPAVAFALLALAFVGLWVRSAYRWDQVNWRVDQKVFVGVNTYWGTFDVRVFVNNDGLRSWFESGVSSSPIADSRNPSWPKSSLLGVGSQWRYNRFGAQSKLPIWFLAASSLALAALFAVKPITRFTVRGLLITTTLLAAVLGLAVYAV